MQKDRITRLEREREQLVSQWSRQEGNKAKLLMKIIELDEQIEELKKGKLDVVEGTLYPLLTRLKNGEFLSYRWEESTGGPPRKYYQITDKGKLFLAELLNTWNELTDSVNQITQKTIN